MLIKNYMLYIPIFILGFIFSEEKALEVKSERIPNINLRDINKKKVNLIDISQENLDKAISTITKNLDRQLAKEKISQEDKSNTLSNISTNNNLSSAKTYDLIIEAATENTDLKLKIFNSIPKYPNRLIYHPLSYNYYKLSQVNKLTKIIYTNL